MTPPIAVDWDALKQEWRKRGSETIRGKLGRTSIDRMNTHEARLHDHRNRKYQNAVQIILFLVGTFSFSGVAALVLTAWYGSNIPGGDTKEDAPQNWPHWDALIVGLFYLAVVAGGYWYLYQRSKPRTIAARWRDRG